MTLSLFVWAQSRLLTLPELRGEGGQTTAEYALMLLGAATVALLLIAWATQTNKINRLLDSVVDTVLDKVS